jgi:hypothetical protein
MIRWHFYTSKPQFGEHLPWIQNLDMHLHWRLLWVSLLWPINCSDHVRKRGFQGFSENHSNVFGASPLSAVKWSVHKFFGWRITFKFHWIVGRVFFARGISPGQIWWTLLGRQISCCEWEGPTMHSRCLAFLLFKLGGRGGEKDFFFIFPWFPMCCH